MNHDAESLLLEIAGLMELNGENIFKVRAFKNAAATLAEQQNWRELTLQGGLEELPGVGKGVASVLKEYVETAHSTLREDLLKGLPKGLLELSRIPGLGPKKARQLITELGIQSVGELEYACRENHLLHLKGFGEKLQARILEGAVFYASNLGQMRLDEALPLAHEIQQELKNKAGHDQIFETGELRRRMEVLRQLDFLIVTEKVHEEVRRKCDETVRFVLSKRGETIAVQFHFCSPSQLGFELARTTASPEHWRALGEVAPFEVATEEDFYKKLKMPWLSPELRESGEELNSARSHSGDGLLDWNGIRGVFHNHTTRSDGSASLEEMVIAAKKLNYAYIGISDHSQSSVYARGLMPEVLAEQEKEIRVVQEKHPEIRIFWGIESDILADGSLDYDEKVLRKFDFVIASVHARFNMDKQAMTDRILKAIRNPYTRFLGHVTGRLLLARRSYEVEMEKILAEAARCGVAVELNSNPQRLDIDWRWGKTMRELGTLTSVNPDAHSTDGLKDVRYGIIMARKALLPQSQIINSRSAKEVEQWLLKR